MKVIKDYLRAACQSRSRNNAMQEARNRSGNVAIIVHREWDRIFDY